MKGRILIAIDVGNTAVSLGVFQSDKVILRMSIPTKECGKRFGKELKGLLRCARNGRYSRASSTTTGNDDVAAIVGSVVPKVDKVIKNFLREARIKYLFVKPTDCDVPILCREPEKVGVDRLLNAVACGKLYKKGAIVVDCGTATTFDVISPKGEYSGGAIAPGLRIGADALAQRCAKLFKVTLSLPRLTIGRDTKEAMLSGTVLGHIAMIEGMTERLKRELKFKPVIIGTGGFIKLIARGIKIFDVIEPDLTLKGLAIVAKGITTEGR
ncbi:type III pantothenate kinase [Candidatus Desantisbacteria bacterium CG07_land_8_20_14_0_80_39_15]|uniref:Type III pantothenate kinase n=1 Tax=Candidatus Desantisbacteria bacterium CG07_land_8_20_14_0_80_39_15 TaxID=1974549 RepID=A0A2M6ZG50_9BACT|nr:MAG: type III pantothenate kinase [Candidatus Desantisbacteria bacterium CG07_land_8_20_14_0_80_39_15]